MTAPQHSPSWRLWSKPAWIAVSAGLAVLVFLIYRVGGASFEWQRFLSTLSRIDWRWLTVSILLALLGNIGRALRWEVMLRPLGRKASLRVLTYDTTIGFTAVVLLGRVGEVVRPYLIAASTGLPFSSQVAAWLLERMLDTLAVLLLFGFALFRVQARVSHLSPQIQRSLGAGGYFFALIGLLCLAIFVMFRNFSGVAQQRILGALTFLPESSYRRAEAMLKAFSQGVECTRSAPLLGLLLAYTVLEWSIIVGSYYSLFLAFSATLHFTLADTLVLLGFMALGSLVQIPGIGGGVQVACIVVLTEIYGVSLEAASGVAILLWAVSMTIVPFGLLCAFHQGLNWSKLKLLSTKQILED